MIHSILLCSIHVLGSPFPQPHSRSYFVYLLVWNPLLHTSFYHCSLIIISTPVTISQNVSLKLFRTTASTHPKTSPWCPLCHTSNVYTLLVLVVLRALSSSSSCLAWPSQSDLKPFFCFPVSFTLPGDLHTSHLLDFEPAM